MNSFNNVVGKEHVHEVLSRDDAFDFSILLKKKMPGDTIFLEEKHSARVVKENISNKLRLYTDRMQKCLHSATQKYIGDCDKRKVINNLYYLSTKIISTSIANIFVGEVSLALNQFFLIIVMIIITII
jgi:hypothetical protein